MLWRLGFTVIFQRNRRQRESNGIRCLNWRGSVVYGAEDPFARVDTLEAVSFLNCIKAASTVEEACECGIEEELGLCS